MVYSVLILTPMCAECSGCNDFLQIVPIRSRMPEYYDAQCLLVRMIMRAVVTVVDDQLERCIDVASLRQFYPVWLR